MNLHGRDTLQFAANNVPQSGTFLDPNGTITMKVKSDWSPLRGDTADMQLVPAEQLSCPEPCHTPCVTLWMVVCVRGRAEGNKISIWEKPTSSTTRAVGILTRASLNVWFQEGVRHASVFDTEILIGLFWHPDDLTCDWRLRAIDLGTRHYAVFGLGLNNE